MDKSLAICNISGQFSVIIDNRIDCTDDLRRRGKQKMIKAILITKNSGNASPSPEESGFNFGLR